MWPKKDPETPPADKQATDLDALIAKIGEMVDAKLSPVNAAVSGLSTKFETLETAARESAKPKEPEVRQQPTSVLDDENRAFGERLGPLAYQNAVLSARVTESEFIAEMKEQGHSKLVPAVRKMIESTPIQTKAGDGYQSYLRNCFKVAFADEAMTKGVKFNGENDSFYLENSNVNGNEPQKRTVGRELDWTDSRNRVHTGDEVLAKLGLTQDDAKEFLQ